MGGYGSGRKGRRQKADDCRKLDANLLFKAGCLRPGYRGSWQWTVEGERVANIELRAKADRLILNYRVRSPGGDWTNVEEPVPLVWLHCRYGGMRPYFLCPGEINGRHCGRRVAKLYGGGIYFLCRHCYGLAHASQSVAPPRAPSAPRQQASHGTGR